MVSDCCPHYLSTNLLKICALMSPIILKKNYRRSAYAEYSGVNEFLRVAAITSSELINYVNIAGKQGFA